MVCMYVTAMTIFGSLVFINSLRGKMFCRFVTDMTIYACPVYVNSLRCLSVLYHECSRYGNVLV